MTTLDRLKPGQQGTIDRLEGPAGIVQRLREMGVLEGEKVELVAVAPLGDPIDVRVQGYQLSLRKSEAAFVFLSEDS